LVVGVQPDPSVVVAARGLQKRFEQRVAVAGVDIDVPRGSFFGMVGPNGAGKSTTIKMCTTLLRPDYGEVWIDGHNVWADPQDAKRRFGVLPDHPQLFERLTGPELLDFLGVFRGLDPAEVARRNSSLIDVLGLGEDRATLIADYSTGMRKKISLAAALLHTPAVLFLDEPFESVDPVSARVIESVLDGYRRAGGTVVLSSHVMETVQRLCDHVVVIHRGEVVKQGEVAALCAERSLLDVFISAVGAEEADLGELDWLRPEASD
jgi:ABC-2 type transport system ATP-binding protein